MNFKELTKEQRRFMFEVYNAMGWSGTLKDELSFDYDPGACEERFDVMLNAVKRYSEQARKFDEMKSLLR